MTKIKICGITREEDARACIELGVDYLGFVFVKESPRYVDPLECGSVAAAFPHAAEPANVHVYDSAAQGKAAATLPHSIVGVFRDQSVDDVHRIAAIARLDLVQLHGSEDEDYVRAIKLPVIRAFKPTEAMRETAAPYVMFDSGGGTGRPFDWSLLANYPRTKPFFLAGGLTPDNVAEAIRVVRPDVVDVSSGVESTPGIKDHQRLRDFIEKVRQS